jgi:DNA-binding GntR family transcriptional regulator
MDGLVLTDKKDRETVREYAYRVLYQNIMELHLIPGTAMSEQEFSSVLSVSRTPVREAFISLSQKGLLDVLPQRGTFVSKIDTEQISEFRFLRVTLEKAIVELACRKFTQEWKDKLIACLHAQEPFVKQKDSNAFFECDNQMHKILYDGCSKSHVWQIIQDSNLDYLRARVLNVTAAKEQMHILYIQHQAIVEAILRSDIPRGVEVMADHINKVIGDVATLQKQYPDYFK